MKSIKRDCSGNIITGLTMLIIILTIISGIILVITINSLNDENIDSISNDNFKSITDDYQNNLDKLLLESIKELSEEVISKKTASPDSSGDIKKILNKKLEEKNKEYYDRYGIKITSNVLSVENSSDPFFIQSKIKISASKGVEKYDKIVIAKASVEGLKDPLPFIKCGKDPSFSYNQTNILYHDSLSNFLKKNDVKNPEGYINANSPLFIKKCPFDPYIHHGDNFTLENCLKNGYYHESNDGSCYLCRLEGKGKCNHYGFEVFIVASENNINESISASDHVIFFDQYPGERYYYTVNHSIFLDSSHKLKYGLS